MNIITPGESTQARQAILGAGVLERYDRDVTFASGQRANNHLSMEKLPEVGSRANAVFDLMARVIRRHGADLLVGIPRGGQNWALQLGTREDIPVAELEVEDKRLKIFRYASTTSRFLVARAARIVVIEDATSRRTNEAGVYESLPTIRERAVACVTGWARDLPEARLDTGVPLIPIVAEFIPYHLTPEHPLYASAILTKLESA